MTPLLPYDTARCPGTGHAICQLCRRREPGHHQWQVTIAPPIDKAAGECGMFIAPINCLTGVCSKGPHGPTSERLMRKFYGPPK